jgi:hypothetical protein
MFVGFTFVYSVVNMIYPKQLILLYEFVAVKAAAKYGIWVNNPALKACLLTVQVWFK